MTRPSEILREASHKLRLASRPVFPQRGAELADALLQMAAEATGSPSEALAKEGVILEIAAERRRQVEALGYTPERDDGYVKQELAQAGAALAVACLDFSGRLWPWVFDSFQPRTHRENLIRAAALLVAEVERLDRAEAKAGA